MPEQVTAQAAPPTLAELEAQRAELDAKIAAAKTEAAQAGIAEVRALMAAKGVTLAMLSPRKPRAASAPRAAKTSTTKGQKVPVKYVGPGGSWSGRGLQPKWLREAIEAGASIESFAV